MKIKSTITSLALLLIAFLLMNNANGPASVQGQDRTGSPLSSGSCNTAGCHDSGVFDPTVSVELLTNTGVSISGYEPGESYNVRVTINASSGTPAAYGFQAVALDANNDNGGTWDFPNGGQQLVVFANGLEYMEHAAPITSNVITTALWDAPAAGGGDVTFYVGAVATNGNTESSGDGVGIASITLTEGFMTATNDLEEALGFSVFPNPTEEMVNLKINSLTSGLVNLRISDVAGKIIRNEQLDLNQGENVKQIDLSNLNNGLYLIYLSNELEVIRKSIVKI